NNRIGTNATGNASLGNTQGVLVGKGASENLIRGNLISGNAASGVVIDGVGTRFNVLRGNFVGTDFTVTARLMNGSAGGMASGGASDNVIGGRTAADRNYISGNGGDGVLLRDTGTTHNAVQGNYIGTSITGNAPLGNARSGVSIASNASGNLVGGA